MTGKCDSLRAKRLHATARRQAHLHAHAAITNTPRVIAARLNGLYRVWWLGALARQRPGRA